MMDYISQHPNIVVANIGSQMLIKALSLTNYFSVMLVTILQANHYPKWEDELIGLKVYNLSLPYCIVEYCFVEAAIAKSLVTQ
jgi:hypothetical protein